MEDSNSESIISIFKPFQADIVSTIYDGFYGYFEKYKNLSLEHSTIARSRLIYDEIVHQARKRFSNKPGAKIEEDQNETIYLILQKTIALRFKKMNLQQRTSNIKTEKVDKFCGQEHLDLIPDTTHLFAGYQPDSTFRNIDAILLTCPKKSGSNAWTIHLTNDDYVNRIIPMDLPNNTRSTYSLPLLKIKTEDKNVAQG